MKEKGLSITIKKRSYPLDQTGYHYTKVKCNENLTKSLTARNGLIRGTNLLYQCGFLSTRSPFLTPLLDFHRSHSLQQINGKVAFKQIKLKITAHCYFTLQSFFLFDFFLFIDTCIWC